MPKITSSSIARLSDVRRLVEASPRASAGVGTLLLASLVVWCLLDTSGELTQEQVQVVRQFVIRTQSLSVQERFNQIIKDGNLTVDETRDVIETAKLAEPGYGLLSDQEKNNNK